MAHIFISYSRRDKTYVQKLNDALKARGKETWVDWEGILPSADWLKEIYTAIESADAVVYILSPDSVASEVCGQEINHALVNNKRVVPVVWREVEPQKVNAVVAAHNWIFARETDDFDKAIELTLTAIETDIEWVHIHTRLLTRSLEWENSGHDGSFALQGRDLLRAEKRLTESARLRPALTPLQIEYILASRRRVSARQRLIFGSGAVIAMVLGFLTLLVQLNRQRSQLFQSREFYSKAVWALADNDVNTAEVLLAKSLTLDERQDSRERYLEARIRGGHLQWLAPLDKGAQTKGVSPNAHYAAIQEVDGSLRLVDVQSHHTVSTMRFGLFPSMVCLAFSPDGSHVATGHENGEVRVWETTTGKQIKDLRLGGEDQAVCLSYAADGHTLAVGDREKMIRLYDDQTGKEKVSLAAGPTEQVAALAFSRDGKHLAAGSWDHEVYLYDLTLPKKAPRILVGHEDGVLSVAFSPNGKSIVSGSWDTNVILWDTKTGQPLRILSGHQSGIVALVFTHDGERLASGSEYGIVRLWDIDTGKNFQTLVNYTTSVTGLAFSPDEKILTTATTETLKTWDMMSLDNQAEVRTLRGHEGTVAIIGVSPDGTTIASGSEDKTVRLWDTVTGEPKGTFVGHTKGVWAVEFSPDNRLVATGSRDKTARLWDAATGKLLRTFPHPEPVRCVAFQPDGKTLVTGGDDSVLRFFDPATGKPIRDKEKKAEKDNGGNGIISMAYTRSGARLAVGTQDGTVTIYDTQTRGVVKTLNAVAGVWGLAYTKDGRTLAAGCADGIARLFDPETGNQIREYRGHKGGIWDITISSDSRYFATAGQDGTTRVWRLPAFGEAPPKPNAKPEQSLYTLRGYLSAVWSAAFTPDSHRLVTCSQDRTIRIWNLPRLSQLMTAPADQLLEETEGLTGLQATEDDVVPLTPEAFVQVQSELKKDNH